MTAEFFDNLRDYSEIKLRILRKFLTPWATKLGSYARRRNGVIWYVDGFAGRGKYDDDSDGSPMLGLRKAKQIQIENKGYGLACFFVEKNRGYWQALEQVVLPFRQDGLTILNRHGEFSELIPDIEYETRGSPVMMFVDPFGLSPLKFEPFRLMLGRQGPLDIILTFQHQAVHRLATEHPDLISDAVGGDRWMAGWNSIDDPEAKIEHVLQEFRQNMLDAGNFIDVVSYPIRESKQSAPRYYLLFASRHDDAFELWNDEVVQEEITLTLKEYGKLVGQTSFFPAIDQEATGLSLLNEIRGLGDLLTQPTNRRNIVMYFVRHKWGEYHTKEIKKAVGALVESGEIRRDQTAGRGSIDTDHLHFVRG